MFHHIVYCAQNAYFLSIIYFKIPLLQEISGLREPLVRHNDISHNTDAIISNCSDKVNNVF